MQVGCCCKICISKKFCFSPTLLMCHFNLQWNNQITQRPVTPPRRIPLWQEIVKTFPERSWRDVPWLSKRNTMPALHPCAGESSLGTIPQCSQAGGSGWPLSALGFYKLSYGEIVVGFNAGTYSVSADELESPFQLYHSSGREHVTLFISSSEQAA